MERSRLPDSWSPRLKELLAPHLAPDQARLSAIASIMLQLRDEARSARKSSGAEDVWYAAEEAYAGIDNANRHEMGHNKWSKPMSPDGPLTLNDVPARGSGKSTIFIPITARYVDAGAAKVSEILLPLDGKAFSFEETPVPDIIDLKDNTDQVVSPELGVPLTRNARPSEVKNQAGAQPAPPVPSGGAPAPVPAPAGPPAGAAAGLPGMAATPPLPPQVPLTHKDLAEEQVQLARKKAKKAEKRIYDWLVESQYPAEARKGIFDAARLGVSVLKAPTPLSKREVVANKVDNDVEVLIRNTIRPGARWVDPWNFFPDPACGENIQNGDHCFERDFLSPHQVRNLAKTPGYIREEIEKVLMHGPSGIKDEDKPIPPSGEQRESQYEAWYFHGMLSREDFWCICHAAGEPPKGKLPDHIYTIVTMIGDCVVKAAFNPLESGGIPYHAVPWRRRPGQWWGIGIAEQVSPAQRITNGAMRAMLNNAGISAGAQVVINRAKISPADGSWVFTPNKIWELDDDSNMPVEQAFGVFQVPNTTAALEEIVQRGMMLAEESTNIPLVTQGQSGPTQPDTLGGLQLQNNNANQLLRQVANNFDDYQTEPMIRQFYEYLLLDPDVPADEKGDYAINAHGSAALVELAIQDQMLSQMLSVALNPAYGLNPRKTMKEFLKSKHFNPAMLENSEEEQAALDQQEPPKAPQVEVAQIRAQTDEKRIKVAQQDVLSDRVVALRELELRRELAILEHAAAQRMTIDQVKAKLADSAMKLNVQRELAVRSEATKQVARPATEPKGRAPNGRAFQA